jgi:hypothetical protein
MHYKRQLLLIQRCDTISKFANRLTILAIRFGLIRILAIRDGAKGEQRLRPSRFGDSNDEKDNPC